MKRKSINTSNTKNKIGFVGSLLNKHMPMIVCMLLLGIMLSSVAFAVADADSLWSQITTLVETWITRLGGVVMFVGGVMFGLGWKNEDAEQKSRGMSTIIAGAIVAAIAALTSTFFS